MDSVEIVTYMQKRRRQSGGGKKTVVEETEQPGMSISAAAASTVCIRTSCSSGADLCMKGALSAVKAIEGVVPFSENGRAGS